MGIERFVRRRGPVLGAAVAAALAGPGVASADLTFNTSLVSTFNPITSQFGTSTPNWYADFGTDGTTLGLGTIEGTNFGGGTGVVFMDISNPAAPFYRSRYNPVLTSNGFGARFQDVYIRNGYAYAAIDDSDAINGGIHILDISNPAAPVKVTEITQANNGFARNHTLTVDGNLLYAQDNSTTTVKVFNITNPAAPTFVRNIVTGGTVTNNVHDSFVKNGRLYTSNIDSGLLEVYDVSDVTSPSWSTATRKIGSITAAQGIGTRNHHNSVTDDGRYIAIARETSNGDVQIWDLQNLATTGAVKVATLNKATYGLGAYTPHNPWIIGDTLYVSWYQAGLQIFNIRNPAAPIHLGAYDEYVGDETAPGQYLSFYDGNWGVNPSLGINKIILSDFDNGIYIVDATNAFRQLWTHGADNNGRWQANARWDNTAGPFPNSSEMIASFTSALGGTTRMLWVDGSLTPARPRVASMEFLSSFNYTVNTVLSGDLELLSSSGPATISVALGANSTGTNTINVPLVLSDDLTVSNASQKTSGTSLDIATIRGTGRALAFDGVGQTGITGANTSFTGTIAVNGGHLVLKNAQAVNSQPITLNGGTLALRGNSGASFGSTVNVVANGNLIAGNNGSGGGFTHSIGNVTVAATKTLNVTRENAVSLSIPTLTINGNATVTPLATLGGAVRAGALNLGAGSKLNLNSSNLIVDGNVSGSWNGSAYTGVLGLVQTGRGDGSWNGASGITTGMTDATTGVFTTLAVATGAEIRGLGPAQTDVWCGQTINGNSTLVMYTWGGDADLNGELNGDDYFYLDSNILASQASPGNPTFLGFHNGDFDYNGELNGDDYFVLDSNILQAQASSPFPTSTGAGLASVPEPSLLTLSLLLVETVRRRRRM